MSLLCVALAAVAVRGFTTLREARTQLVAAQPGPVDIGFAQAMAVHHQQAIGMARQLIDGRPTALAALARSIADEQLLEIGQMQGWLRLWDQPFANAARQMDWMLLGASPPDAALRQYLLDCSRAPLGMSGMASAADLERLRSLESGARDRLFLDLMLAHHQGGLPMARFAARQARLMPVRELAARIVLEQSEQIASMQRMQQVLAASRWPAP